MNLTKHRKLKFKLPAILRKLIVIARRISQKLGLTGARELSLTNSGMATLVLNRNYPLGAKGSKINLVKSSDLADFWLSKTSKSRNFFSFKVKTLIEIF